MSTVLKSVSFTALALILCVTSTAVRAAAPPESETSREIAYLIATVRGSSSTFIRNGTTHPGPAAADHMKAKGDYYRTTIKTAEDFIRLAATKSALTGTLYQVHHPDGVQESCSAWLTRLLQAYRARNPLVTPNS